MNCDEARAPRSSCGLYCSLQITKGPLTRAFGCSNKIAWRWFLALRLLLSVAPRLLDDSVVLQMFLRTCWLSEGATRWHRALDMYIPVVLALRGITRYASYFCNANADER